MEDQLGRTCLHVTVEENNIRITECLLVSGTEVNRPEGCGVMPLMIAIIKEQLEMTQLLLKYHAKAHGTFAGLIPSPLQRAESTNNDLIASLLKNHIGQDVQQEKAIFSAYLNSRTQGEPTANDPRGCHVQDASSYQDSQSRQKSPYFPSKGEINRNQRPEQFLRNRFQGWLENSKDTTFNYNTQNLFDHLFLLDFFHSSVRLGNGKALEVLYFILPPLFFAMNKRL